MDTIKKQEVDDPLQETKDFGKRLANYFAKVHQIMDEYDCLLQRVATLEAEKARLEDTVEQLKKDDEWTSRVTYENVVEQIASNEDASKRDDARRMFEPLLKKGQVGHQAAGEGAE